MYVVIDKNTSTVLYRGTFLMNEGEYLDIDIDNFLSEKNTAQREIEDIKISESLYLKPLFATSWIHAKWVYRFGFNYWVRVNGKEAVEVLIDVCNSKIEIPTEVTGSVGVDIRFIDSKPIVYCLLKLIDICCELNSLALVKRILELKINTNFPYEEFKSLCGYYFLFKHGMQSNFIERYGYKSKMKLFTFILFSYYSIDRNRKELTKFLGDNYPGITYQQVLFDSAVYHKKESIVQEHFFKVETNSENIRKMTDLAYTRNNIELIRLILDNCDKLKGELDENALKTAIRKKDYELAQEIITKYPNTVSVSCLEEAVKNKDMDMVWLLIENGASVELVDQVVIENLLRIINHEIADRILELIDVKKEKEYSYHNDTTVVTMKFNKTMLCLIWIIHIYDLYDIVDDAIEFEEFHEHLDLYENILVIANLKKKNITEAFDTCYTCFHVLELIYEQRIADFYKVLNFIMSYIDNDVKVTFSDTKQHEPNEFRHEEDTVVSNGIHYELAKSEFVNRNFEVLKLLIEYGININCGNSLILKTAYKAGDIGWIDYFISKGAKFNEESDGFDEACKSDKVEVLEHWIKNGGVVPNNPEYLCINMACLLGNFKMVKLLVENGVDLSDPKTNGVRIACRLGFRKTLKYLLDNNAVLGRICRYQLEYACLTEDIGLVKIILGYYDNLGVLEKRETSNTKEDEEPQNDSLLDNENSGHSEKYKITNTLLETGEPIQNSDLVDGIKASASVANIEILKLLLTYKINYNDNFEIDEAAVQTGNIDVVKTFLDNGISVDGDEVALDIAFREKNTEMIKLLLRHGAKVKSDSNNLCLYFGVIDTETLLLMLTCCTELKDDQSLLEFAVCKNNLEAVKLLLKDTISLKDSKYNFVFHACENNNLEILKFLFEKGAKIQKGRLSGVNEACKNNNLEMLKLLLEKDPNLVLNRDYGIKGAIEHKNIEMVKLLIKYEAYISSYVGSIMEVAIDTNDHELIKICESKMAEVKM